MLQCIYLVILGVELYSCYVEEEEDLGKNNSSVNIFVFPERYFEKS